MQHKGLLMATPDEISKLMEELHEKQCSYLNCPWEGEKNKIIEGLNTNKKLEEIYTAPHHNYFRTKSVRILNQMDYESISKSIKLIYSEAYKLPEE